MYHKNIVLDYYRNMCIIRMQPRTFSKGGCIVKEFELIKAALKKCVIMHGARIVFLACPIVKKILEHLDLWDKRNNDPPAEDDSHLGADFLVSRCRASEIIEYFTVSCWQRRDSDLFHRLKIGIISSITSFFCGKSVPSRVFYHAKTAFFKSRSHNKLNKGIISDG